MWKLWSINAWIAFFFAFKIQWRRYNGTACAHSLSNNFVWTVAKMNFPHDCALFAKTFISCIALYAHRPRSRRWSWWWWWWFYFLVRKQIFFQMVIFIPSSILQIFTDKCEMNVFNVSHKCATNDSIPFSFLQVKHIAEMIT